MLAGPAAGPAEKLTLDDGYFHAQWTDANFRRWSGHSASLGHSRFRAACPASWRGACNIRHL